MKGLEELIDMLKEVDNTIVIVISILILGHNWN